MKKIIAAKREYSEWCRAVGITNLSDLAKIIEAGEAISLINLCEARQERKYAEAADQIFWNRRKCRIVMMSGPSSSGKTSSSLRIAQQARVLGLNPKVIELDNYFVDRDRTPRDAQGNYDFEALEAMDVAFLNEQLSALLKGEEVEIPKFDFKEGCRKFVGNRMKLEANDILFMEGIHALNPLITYGLDYDSFYKICMNVDSAFFAGDEMLLSSRDVRFLRRSIRDFKHRGAALDVTYGMWPGVCEGEDQFIKPFYPYADMMLNTVYCYEPLVYKPLILPMLAGVVENPDYGVQAKELYRKMLRFGEIELGKVPSKSLLQEFIG